MPLGPAAPGWPAHSLAAWSGPAHRLTALKPGGRSPVSRRACVLWSLASPAPGAATLPCRVECVGARGARLRPLCVSPGEGVLRAPRRRLQAGGQVESLPLTRPVTLDKSSRREVPQIPATSAVDKGGGPFPWTGSGSTPERTVVWGRPWDPRNRHVSLYLISQPWATETLASPEPALGQEQDRLALGEKTPARHPRKHRPHPASMGGCETSTHLTDLGHFLLLREVRWWRPGRA